LYKHRVLTDLLRDLFIFSSVGIIVSAIILGFYFLVSFYIFLLGRITGLSLDIGTVREDFTVLANLNPGNPVLATLIMISLLAGFTITFLRPHTRGAGVEKAIEAYHLYGARISPKDLVAKIFASTLTVGGGGSSGFLGPSIYIGGGIGGLLADVFKAVFFRRKIFFLAGIAAALSTIFNAPLGAAIYAIETPHRRDLELRGLAACLFSSFSAHVFKLLVIGGKTLLPRFQIDPTIIYRPENLLSLIILGLLTGVAGKIFLIFYTRWKQIIHRNKQRLWIGILVGSTITVIAYFISPLSVGSGTTFLSELIVSSEEYAVIASFIVLILVLRIIETVTVIGSGGSGGLFAPSIVIGGILGFLYAIIIRGVIETQPIPLYIYAGMASFYGGISATPIGTSIMIGEMSGNYLLIPVQLLLGVISREVVGRDCLCKTQTPSRLTSSLEKLTYIHDLIFRKTPILLEKKLREYEEIFEKTAIITIKNIKADKKVVDEILDKLYSHGLETVIVKNTKNEILGLIEKKNLVQLVFPRHKQKLPITPVIEANVDTTIAESIRKMTLNNIEYLVITMNTDIRVVSAEKLYDRLLEEIIRQEKPK